MDTTVRYKIVEKIVNTEDETLLQEVFTLLNMSETDFWSDLPVATQTSIERGIADAQQGKTRPHQEVIDEIKARFAK